MSSGGNGQRQRFAALTGANRGIGQATARALRAAGYTVLAGARQPPAGGADAAGPAAGALHYLRLDLTDGASIERFAAAAGAIAGGSLCALINNAGVGALGPAEEFSEARARQVFEVNLWGAMRLTQRLLPLLRAGAAQTAPAPTYLLNVGSLIAEFPVPYHAAYAASKGALRAYSLALRGELADHGVAVVLLEPGDVASGITPLRGAASAAATYRAGLARVEAARARKMAAAPPPEAVARRVLQVLAKRRPPPVVACGGAAPALRFLRRLLPDRLAVALTRRSYGLHRGADYR